MDKEFRYQSGDLEIRAGDNNRGAVGGYAIVFDQLSENLGGFRERIAPTALDGVDLGETVALFNHDSSKVLGSARSGTLTLEQDDGGLRFNLDMPATTYAADLYEMVKRGDISGSSFGFYVADDGDSWEMGPDKVPVRTVTSIGAVPEVSVGVVFPAYPQSSTVIHRCNGFIRERSYRSAAAHRARQLRLLELGA